MVFTFQGNLVHNLSADPIPGLWVEIWHGDRLVARAAEPTDQEGNFRLEIDEDALEEASRAEAIVLAVKVKRDDGNEIDIVRGDVLLLGPDQPERQIEIAVDLPVEAPPPESIESVEPLLERPIPVVLAERLRRRGIASLDDIRAAGGLARIEGLAGPAEEPAIAALDAHANLLTLSTEPATRARLIEAGFTSVLDVATAFPEALASALGDGFERSDIESLHALAEGQVKVLENLLTDIRVNGVDEDGGVPISSAMASTQQCVCRDCEDAASPMAYLADLVDYVADHLKLAGGLRGEYFSGITVDRIFGAPDQRKTPEVVRVDAAIDFDWGTGPPPPLTAANEFSIRWTGQVQPRFSETYTFRTVSDDGVRLWVNGRRLIDNWTEHGPTENTGTIDLVANQRYDIRLEYFESTGGAAIRLLWSSPSQTQEVIPGARLYAAVTARVLAEQFLQPFDRWPMTCELVDKEVAQARICIEVLRKLLSNDQTSAAWLSAAHSTLLDQNGTSYRELAEALSGPRRDRERMALARRLGIALHQLQPTPYRDELNELFDAGGSETTLEWMFGWRDTKHDPFDPTTVPVLLTWRGNLLRDRWRGEDWPTPAPAGARPIIDPDVIRLEDITALRQPTEDPRGTVARTNWYAGDFWDERDAWIRATLGDVRTARDANGLTDLLDLLQTNVFFLGSTGMEGITTAELTDLRNRQQAGEDISNDLTNLRLRQDEFAFLSSIVDRDQINAVRDWEWSELYSLIAQRVKQYVLFPIWREEERLAGILHGPDEFRLRPAMGEQTSGSMVSSNLALDLGGSMALGGATSRPDRAGSRIGQADGGGGQRDRRCVAV